MSKIIFGIDVGGTTCKCGTFSEEGELLRKEEIPTRKDEGGSLILPDISEYIKGVLADMNMTTEDVAGIGMGLPGACLEDGTVNKCINLGWGVFNAANALSELTGIPVKIGNDANMAALGEFWVGGGSEYNSMVMVTIGTGVGGGVIIDGKPLYGFNGAAAKTGPQLASIFMTTTIAPAVATVVCMIFTWLRYGKPDVSMCLNASLAGLVAITAPCDVTDALGALIIGAVSGVLVVFGVWFCDYVAHVDDPVGAVAVHCLNGIWGTIAVGLFATTTAPECEIKGLFYGGGFKQLGIQLVGIIAVIAWTAVTMTIVFAVIKATIGLRVSEEEEIVGLDSKEHGLASAYAGFSIMDITEGTMAENENTDLGVADYDAASKLQRNAAVPVVGAADLDTGMHKVVINAKLTKYERLKTALNNLGVTGMTVTQVMGCGIQKGAGEKYRGVEMDVTVLPKVKVEVIVGNIPVEKVIETATKTLYTGHVGDGKIFVYNVQKVVKVRTGEEDLEALKDVE